MDTNPLSDTLSENIDDFKETVSRGIGKIVVVLLLVYLVAIFCIAWYWSREPDLLQIHSAPYPEVASNQVIGITTTQTLQDITRVLLEKNGGYISNDLLPPGVLMDDMPNWEYGVLVQLRDFSKVLKETMGRAPAQLREDNDLVVAESRFRFDSHSWMVPASESQYREGMEHLQAYQDRLQGNGTDNAAFVANTENLNAWLVLVELRLNSLSQRLSASVGPRRLDNGGSSEVIKTPWMKVDDIFYEARGTTWALIPLLKAVQIDFAETLKQKNATEQLQQIIVELEETQQPVRSPMILNGSGFGILTNHSLVMASYIARSRAEIADLRNVLATPTNKPTLR